MIDTENQTQTLNTRFYMIFITQTTTAEGSLNDRVQNPIKQRNLILKIGYSKLDINTESWPLESIDLDHG